MTRGRRTDHRRTGPLPEAVDRFVAGYAGAGDGSPQPAAARDEAARLVARVLVADGDLSSAERMAWREVFPDLDPLHAGRSEEPLDTFARLVEEDASDEGDRAWRYYGHAMALAHAAVAVPLVPRSSQLASVDGLRDRMLALIAAHGLSRPAPRELADRLTRDVGMWLPWQDDRESAPASVVDHHGAIAETAGRGRSPAPGRESATAASEEPVPAASPRPVGEVLADLDALIGLSAVKTQIRRVTDLETVHRLRRERDLPVSLTSHHLVFTGNPGTGKTTVARLVAEIYAGLGVVSRPQLIETDRSALVVGYVGQTATRVREVVETALGGVLLIDEVYALARGGERDFGQEAIDTLVKLMEDHRDDLVVIVAGYPKEMAEFIGSNPGLESRFPRTIEFPDYDDEEMLAILERFAVEHRYELDAGALEAARRWLAAQPRGSGFGNGRLVRNLFEEAISRQASRLVSASNHDALGDSTSAEQLVTLTREDLPPPVDDVAVDAGTRPPSGH